MGHAVTDIRQIPNQIVQFTRPIQSEVPVDEQNMRCALTRLHRNEEVVLRDRRALS